MANSKIPNLNLSDTLNTQRLKFNQLLDSVGDVSTLTTTGTNVTAAINELDAELGTISGRLDSINTTELLSPRATLTDSSATSIVRGNLQVDTDLHVNGDTTNTRSVTIDGLLTTRANVVIGNSAGDQLYLNSSINTDVVPYDDNAFDLGSPTKEWRHVYVDGTVNADNVAADSATIGTLTVTGDTTFNNAITVQDSAYITGNLAVGGNTTMAGTLTVDGQVTFKAGSDNNIALGDAATDTITLTGEVNSNIIPDGDNDYDLGSPTKEWRHVYVDGTVNTDNLAADSATIGTLTVTGDTTLNNTITVQDSAYITGDLDLGSNLDVAGNVNVTGTVVSEGALTVEDSAYVTGNLDVGNNLTVATAATLASAAVSDLTNDRIVVVGASGELEDDGNLTWNGSTLDITGDLSVSAGFTVGGTFTTTGITRNAASYVIVNDGVAVANGNRAGLAVDRPSNDSAVIQWNELGDYWEAGTTAGVERLALQNDSAAFNNIYAPGSNTLGTTSIGSTTMSSAKVSDLTNNRVVIAGTSGELEDDANLTFDGTTFNIGTNTVINNALTVQDSAYITSNLVVGGNFTVNGTTTTINTTNMVIEDNVMVLNSTQTGTPATSLRSGLEVERGSSTNINLQWNELNDYWEAAEDGSNTLGRVATSGWLNATSPIVYNSTSGNFSHASSGVTPGTYLSVTVDSNGHVTAGTNPTYDNYVSWTLSGDGGSSQTIASGNTVDIAGGTYITTTAGATDTLTVAHDNTSRSNTTTAATLAHSDAFEVVDSIQSNATGHITGVNTRTITLPAGAVPNDATITISGGTDLETGGSFTTDQSGNETITLNHSDTVRSDTTTAVSPGSAGSFDVVDSIQSNARGHVTQVNTKTITLPASATYSAGNDLDLSGNTFNIEPELNFVNSISYASGDFTLATTGADDIIINPGTAGLVYFRGDSAGEQLTFALGANNQNITSSDAMHLITGSDLNAFVSGDVDIDASGDITLDAGGGQIYFKDDGNDRGYWDVTLANVKFYTGSGTLNSTWSGDDLTVQGDITSISDIRTKENIETIENGLELVESLRGVYYTKIGEEDRKVGVIAQETEEVLPEVVMTDQEGMKSVDYGKMVGVLIEAIKDLKAEVEELKANKCNCGE
jgi:cytoskeletal protein CcmA (bactofilin family)